MSRKWIENLIHQIVYCTEQSGKSSMETIWRKIFPIWTLNIVSVKSLFERERVKIIQQRGPEDDLIISYTGRSGKSSMETVLKHLQTQDI